MLFDILIFVDTCSFFSFEIAVILNIIITYVIDGVHHIHYNKDYNPPKNLTAGTNGVHHIHYNKDCRDEINGRKKESPPSQEGGFRRVGNTPRKSVACQHFSVHHIHYNKDYNP